MVEATKMIPTEVIFIVLLVTHATAVSRDKHERNPINNFKKVVVTDNLSDNSKLRSTLVPKTCRFPLHRNDIHLSCEMYPSITYCTQTCKFGRTLSDGIQRNMTCKHSDNKWEPKSTFETCKPFVNCNVILGPGASMYCYENLRKAERLCDFSCAHYEDKSAIPRSRYVCNIWEEWKPKLPFCIKRAEEWQLVPRPFGKQFIEPEDL